jgi:hypothetical protein
MQKPRKVRSKYVLLLKNKQSFRHKYIKRGKIKRYIKVLVKNDGRICLNLY